MNIKHLASEYRFSDDSGKHIFARYENGRITLTHGGIINKEFVFLNSQTEMVIAIGELIVQAGKHGRLLSLAFEEQNLDKN